MIRKVLSVLAIIICLVMIFSTNGFALEYVDFNQEIDVFCEYVKNEMMRLLKIFLINIILKIIVC